jgi:hypothetical protein
MPPPVRSYIDVTVADYSGKWTTSGLSTVMAQSEVLTSNESTAEDSGEAER